MAKAQTQTKGHVSTVTIADELGITPLSPAQLIRELHHCAETNTPALVLGRPGVGKTEIIEQLARDLHKKLIVERLNGRDPTDMGLPYVYTKDTREEIAGYKRHGWTLPEYYPTADDEIPEDNEGGWCLFFDELAQALPAMQNRIGEMLNERQLNGVAMHKKAWIVLAANFAQDKAATYPIPRQILNRCAVFVLSPDEEDFRRYCSEKLVRPEIVAYSKLRPDCLDSYDPDSMVNCTPRSLVSLSKLMDCNPSYEDELPLYSGRIGKGFGSEFVGFLRVYRDLPKREDIEANPNGTPIPDEDETDVMCALAAMLGRALNKKNAAPIVKYLVRLPVEFCVFALRDAARRDPSLRETKAFNDWAVKHGDVLF